MLAVALLLLASGPAPDRPVDGSPTVAVLLETTAGTAALAEKLESALRETGADVRSASEVRAARRFLGMAYPLGPEDAQRLRKELGAERLVIVSSRTDGAGEGEVYLMLHLVDPDGSTRRFAAATITAADEAVLQLLAEAPPPPHRSERKSGGAAGDPASGARDAYEVPGRTVLLADPAFASGLEHSTVLVEGTNGAFYQGVVTEARPERLELLVGSAAKPMTFRAGEVKSLRTLRVDRPPVYVGESAVFHLLDGSTVAGGVVTTRSAGAIVRTANGAKTELRWADLVRVEVPPATRTVDIADPRTLGLSPTLVRRVTPRYPSHARAANVTGVVVVEIVADITGRVVRTRIVRSSPMFDASALEAVSQWVYEPLVLEGRPVSWRGPITLRFELRDDDGTPEPSPSGEESSGLPARSDATGSNAAVSARDAAPSRGAPPVDGPTYGEAGTLELGAVFGYVNSTRRWEIEGVRSRVQGADLLLRPTIAYFPHDGVELLVRPGLRRSLAYYSGPDEYHDTSWSLAVGAGYFLPFGVMRAGVQATGGVYALRSRDTGADGTLHVTEGGRLGTFGFVAKAPVGSAAMMTVELNYFSEASDVRLRLGSARASGTGSLHGVEVTFGFSYWRPRGE